MINKIGQPHSLRLWFLIHVFLGLVSTLTRIPFILWIVWVSLSSFLYLINVQDRERGKLLALFIAYLSSFELLGRMVKASPFVPYELGKYSMFVLLLWGIMSGYTKGRAGFLLLLLLLPGFLVNESNSPIPFQKIIFSGLGPVVTCLSIIFFWKLKLTQEEFIRLLRVFAYPLITVLVFTFIKTPDFDEIEFTLGANFETSGGFGSNQVSTALGFGMFLMFVFWVNRWKFSSNNWLDITLLFGMAFQGLLTFSRGGMLGGIIGILLIITVLNILRLKAIERGRLKKINRYAILGILSIGTLFLLANSITGGLLVKRYQGETYGTILGTKEKDINVVTTGRWEIFLGDLELWQKYPILGTGVGISQPLRENIRGVISHVEVSRLLAEQEIVGLIYSVVLFFYLFLF